MAESGLAGFDVAPMRLLSRPSQQSINRCRISVRQPLVPRLRISPDIFRPTSPNGVRSFAMPTVASTVETHLICSKGEADHVRSVPVRRRLPRGNGLRQIAEISARGRGARRLRTGDRARGTW